MNRSPISHKIMLRPFSPMYIFKKLKKPHTYETILFVASMMIHGGINKQSLIKIMSKISNDVKYMHHIIK
jgi:hypothetical protein